MPEPKMENMRLWAVIRTDQEYGIGLFQTITEALEAAEMMTEKDRDYVYVPIPMMVQGVSQGKGKGSSHPMYYDRTKEVTSTSWNPRKGYL
jgi:hypothetical protein